MHYAYILISEKDNLLYTGYTPNLTARIKKHNLGFVRSTKKRLPMKLIYFEAYTNMLDAMKREKYLKGGKGKSELKVQLRETFLDNKYRCS